MLYRKSHEESTKKLLELTNEFRNLTKYRSIYKYQLNFYTLAMNSPKMKLTILLTITSKRIK